MTDMEMEVDMHRHADDDLIDFDTDMNDEHDSSSQHNNHTGQYSVEVSTHIDEIEIDVENVESHEYQEADAEMSDEADLANIEETMQDADHIIEEVDETVYHEHLVAEEHREVPAESTEIGGDDQGEVSHELETSDPHSHSTDKAAKKGNESDNEIDYELEEDADQSLEHASRDEAPLEAENGPVPTEVPATTVKPDTQPEGSEALGKESNAEAEDSHKERDDRKVIEEESEITYEEDDHVAEGTLAHDVEHDAEPAPIGSAEGVVEEEEEEEEEVGQAHPESEVHGENEENNEEGEGEYPHDEAKVHTPTSDEGVEHAEYDEYDVGAEVAEESTEQQAHVPEHSHSPSGHGSIVDESEFPAIEVQYQGQSFPMFSHEDGFFSDVSLLDETVDKLLSAFRGELSNELSEEDEIVLHVDELGLRFCESSSPDFLASVTLRQVLEIFDLLVKNQDPDASQMLFIYVLIKPCPIKRLEFLIESATEGKGIGEISRLFSEQTPETGYVDIDAHSADDGFNEISDAYESPDTAEVSKEEVEFDGQHDDDEIDLENPTNDDAVDDDDKENQEQHRGGSLNDDVGHYVEDEMPQQQEDAASPAAPEEHGQDNAYDETDAGLQGHYELDNEQEHDEVDFDAGDVVDEQSQAELDEDHIDAANTSTTTTLRAEDDTGSLVGDTGLQVGVVQVTEHDDDELEEIDWRDEPEAQVADEAPSPQSAPGKRARGDDDELDADVEQDVKRRRP